jgi:phosphoserine phosphatase
MDRPLTIYVDVDDTLARHVGRKTVPMPRTIAHVRSLHEEGATLYCWSTGGAEYAERIATDLGIGACFAGFLPKPNVLLDDQAVADWRQTTEVTPSEATGRTLADYRRATGL